MRVSSYYHLRGTQPTLDFVDVDITGDVRFFVDPTALLGLRSAWGAECVALVQDFFRTVLDDIADGRHDHARALLSTLREPNETHLGLSRGPARGRALGRQSAGDVWKALKDSEAVRSGLLEDLEDTILMIDGVAADIVSDITTNIIREPLIRYTQDVAQSHDIDLQPGVDSGPLWDPRAHEWFNEFTTLPVTTSGKLLLVPKVIVRQHLTYDADEYYRHYLLPFLGEMELGAQSGLVRLLKSGAARVTKRDLEAKYGRGKATIVAQTRAHPEVLASYRKAKRLGRITPMSHLDIASRAGTPQPDWDALLAAVTVAKPGNEGATAFHRAVEDLLAAVFYPSLTNPKRELEIHEGRKRIDISFVNAAADGFFEWLATHYPAAHVFAECKNYGREVANPELDQLAGRFSPSRGQFGLLVCRSFQDKDLFIRRCADTAKDGRGFIVALDDDDLASLVDAGRASGYNSRQFELLKERFDQLIL